jgi:hypothetical protein
VATALDAASTLLFMSRDHNLALSGMLASPCGTPMAAALGHPALAPGLPTLTSQPRTCNGPSTDDMACSGALSDAELLNLMH